MGYRIISNFEGNHDKSIRSWENLANVFTVYKFWSTWFKYCVPTNDISKINIFFNVL